MSKSLEDRLAAIGDEAEAGEEDQTAKPIPANVKVTRGNPRRSRVLQVRLNPDEHAAIERIAERRGLPASTVAREELLKLVAEEDSPDRPFSALLAAVDRVRALAVDVVQATNFQVTIPADSDVDVALNRFRLLGDQLRREHVSVSELLEALGIPEKGVVS
jgi:hypothetical protein